MTSYSVYDVSSPTPPYAATYTTTTNPLNVKVIKISVTARNEASVAANSPGDQRATMESTVQLRLNLP